MKNYFIANGEILNTNMGIEEMESRVQESLNESTSGLTQFRIKEISEKEVRFFFIRDFICNPNKHIIYDADMNLITDLGIEAFQPLDVGGYPLIYPLKFAGKTFIRTSQPLLDSTDYYWQEKGKVLNTWV